MGGWRGGDEEEEGGREERESGVEKCEHESGGGKGVKDERVEEIIEKVQN